MRSIALTVLLFLSALLIGAYFLLSPSPIEVQTITLASSPNGQYEARVEMRVYGPGIGGATPAIEVRIYEPKKDIAEGVLVFSTEELDGTVIRWKDDSHLVVTHNRSGSVNVPANPKMKIKVETQARPSPQSESRERSRADTPNLTLHSDKIHRLARRSCAVAPVREPANFAGELGR
jgi:hypothetical protein